MTCHTALLLVHIHYLGVSHEDAILAPMSPESRYLICSRLISEEMAKDCSIRELSVDMCFTSGPRVYIVQIYIYIRILTRAKLLIHSIDVCFRYCMICILVY